MPVDFLSGLIVARNWNKLIKSNNETMITSATCLIICKGDIKQAHFKTSHYEVKR